MNYHIDSTLVKTLESRWIKLLESNHIEQQIGAPIFQEILSAHSEPHRHYHNLNHLNHMFQELDSYETDSCENGSSNKVTNEMLWAVWYHDFIYKPGAKTNEKRSAKKASDSMLRLNIQQSNINTVVSLILATEKHQANSLDRQACIFLDVDMAILGSDVKTYTNYCESIRKEHASIPDFLFNRGRRKFLSQTLKQGPIFISPYFHGRYERTARKNIEKELR
jgi:predicted metal-dependent HD superfamily phosphohydrolase